MITKYDTNCDTVYGRQNRPGGWIAAGEMIKRQYCEVGFTWDIINELGKEDGRTQYLIAAPGFVTMVTLTKSQQKKRIKNVITTHREYSINEYKYCRCDEGWNGRLRGKDFRCGIPYVDQLGF